MLEELLSDPMLLIETFGYIGVFVVSAISTSTIILPLPGFAIIPIAALMLNPFLVGIIGGTGAAVGELVSYGIGRGSGALTRKAKKDANVWFDRLEKWFEKYNGFMIIVIFSVTPLPFDIIGVFAGMIKYDIKKFFIATLIGRVILYLILAYTAVLGIDILGNGLDLAATGQVLY
jgi:membrane protein DedA with SNARE-associated domain